jgi:hypothetical protein
LLSTGAEGVGIGIGHLLTPLVSALAIWVTIGRDEQRIICSQSERDRDCD